MERIPRGVRLNEQEWKDFKRLLGADWLRGQIDKAVKREQRKPIAQTKDQDQ